MKSIVADPKLVAYCGLYCGACKKYLKGSCQGCAKNEKATWCNIRLCCIENNYTSCADCKEFDDVNDCKKYNNFVAKVFGVIFRSDRRSCIIRIKEVGNDGFAKEMAEKKVPTIKR
ncbi:DUF3795 domain-containing protein [Anaerolineales bacterium HSG24]|nr:DUF3795 domain-containing protein [Anaerolineales bacterium HSG24]